MKKDFFVAQSRYVVYEQQNAIYDRYETRYHITSEKFEELNKFSLKPGDFIMSGAGTIGKISQVPNGITPGVFNQALIRLRINNTVTSSQFFLHWMRSNKMQRKLTESNPGSAITNLVPMAEIKKWNVILPAKKEQEFLGILFQKMDNLITLHQRRSLSFVNLT